MAIDKNIKDQVFRAQISQLFVQFKGLPLVGVIAGSMLTFLMWDVVEHTKALIWFSLNLIYYGVCIPAVVFIEKHYNSGRVHSTASLVICAAGGVIWGSTAYFLDSPGAVFHEMALLTFAVGVASIGAIIYVSYRPAFYAQVIPELVPFIIKFAIAEQPQYLEVSACVAFYLIILLWFNRFLYDAFIEALYLRFQLAEQKELAENAKQAQTQFFAAASHDLRQPLHAYGLLATSLRKHAPSPQGQQILDTMSSSMDAMRGLLDTVLDISRLDAGAMVPQVTRFDIQPLMEQLFLEQESAAAERGNRLVLRTVSAEVTTDRAFLERILRNLIANSIQYTKNGTVLLASRRRIGSVRIEVRDSGRGIAKDYHDKIFRPYERIAGSDSDNPTGMGLGLAIVQRLVKLLDVKLGFRSQASMGSIFYIDFPLAGGNEPLVVDQENDNFMDLGGKKVMVIDDNKTVLFALQYLLQGWGATVVSFDSGAKAVEYLESAEYTSPDLMLVDYQLPGENGLEILGRVHQICQRKIPAVMMTGDTAVSKIIAFSRYDVNVLYKPVAPETLKREIVNVLGDSSF
ncbi:MAG: hybrid sensor histidine kinase/response regulator [Gammaproteobacteria bacterium]|nr:hybrid sensor histidine kinase/response regulator [Gammaproteobacteria bacterium]MDH5802217.1 hybrid sensor histidine kinase/response regulator [Gammaproteobacteria bacterium]